MPTPIQLPVFNVNPITGKRTGKSVFPTYIPLVKVQVRGRENNATPPIFVSPSSAITTDGGFAENAAIKCFTNQNIPGVKCGGHYYGGRMALPVDIPVGNRIWQRFRVKFPTNFNFGYTYGTSQPTTPTEDGCGSAFADGNPTGTKFLVFSPNNGTARVYFNMPNSLRAKNQTLGTGKLAIEASPFAQQDLSFTFPRNQWVTCEMMAYVSNVEGVGYARIWVDGVLVAEALNTNTIVSGATGIREYGIGDYFNGTPWGDNSPDSNYFYVDDVIVATDMNGYGAPTETDAAGNLMIGTTIRVRDFA